MAESVPTEPPLEIPPWLKTLPLAPTYYPTLSEFQDPISYIFKIEKEASLYGICKIVPPLPQASKATVITNFNRSLSARTPTSSSVSKTPPTFTTLNQQVGFLSQTDQKLVWQSKEEYTFKQFEAKAKKFEKTHFKRIGKRDLSEMEIESRYWKAWGGKDEPFTVECITDIPGSAFVPINGKKLREVGAAETVADTQWNMRVVGRARGSLLRFMKEEIPGVTSPVMDLAMLFSWFAWHVEDHDLPSLNYIHTGASKTWYGVPKKAATTFEEVVRVHGNGEVNPIVTYATLVEKTTMLSPEVFIAAGVPCCRLVQNAGEFVVTFPRAYHSGFSHGFNCGEIANIATPDWLMVANEAAVRRASINYPPILSHLQLLYALGLSLYSRIPLSITTEPRSSRLKEKQKTEGETIVKELLVKTAIQNNELLHVLLEQGSSCVLLRQNSRFLDSIWNPGEVDSLKTSVSNEILQYRNTLDGRENHFKSMPQYPRYLCEGSRTPSLSLKFRHYGNANCNPTSGIEDTFPEKGSASHSDGILDHGMFSCVRCGIVSFPCAAVIEPGEKAAQFFASFQYKEFLDRIDASAAPDNKCTDADWTSDTLDLDPCSGRLGKNNHGEAQNGISSLDLLASCYGNLSDSEDEKMGSEIPISDDVDNTRSNQSYSYRSADEVLSQSTILSPLNPRHSDEEATRFHSSTKHIFCLEHAVEVEKRLRVLGGAHLLLVCHPDYPRVETEVKALAAELEINYLWKDILFRDATEDDQARIQSALNVKVADPRAADWTIKLEINLSHTAAISQAPQYKKMLPLDSVVCKAFGCSSSIDPSVRPKISGKRTVKHRKAVVGGKWCGMVWMSNKVHPYLTPRYGSRAESFHSQPRPKLKVASERKAELITQTEQSLVSKEKPLENVTTAATRKSERKRKGTLEKGVAKKPKCSSLDGQTEAVQDLPVHSPPSRFGMILRSSGTKHKASTPCTNREKREEEVVSGTDTRMILRSSAAKHKASTPCTNREKQKEEAASGTNTRMILRSSGTKHKASTPCTNREKRKEEAASGTDTRMILRSSRTKHKASTPSTNREKQKEEAASEPDTSDRRKLIELLKDLNVNSASKKQASQKNEKKTCKKHVTVKDDETKYHCNLSGCKMEFSSKQELVRHKRNICLAENCGKKFFSHEYLNTHMRVHVNDRPLKCPWKGCKKAFKWAWARTEHIRVHTGERPYHCQEPGCSRTFRFITDFSRHKRKTGHSVKKKVD